MALQQEIAGLSLEKKTLPSVQTLYDTNVGHVCLRGLYLSSTILTKQYYLYYLEWCKLISFPYRDHDRCAGWVRVMAFNVTFFFLMINRQFLVGAPLKMLIQKRPSAVIH
jgi:hypothetical protein